MITRFAQYYISIFYIVYQGKSELTEHALSTYFADRLVNLSYDQLDSWETSQLTLFSSENSSNSLGRKNVTDDIQPDNHNGSRYGGVIEENEILQTINDLEYPSGENWQPQGNDSSIEIDNFFEATRQLNHSWIVNSTTRLKKKDQPIKYFPALTADKYTELKNLRYLIVAPKYFNGSRSWDTAWRIHVYFFGSAFLLTLFCSVFSLTRSVTANRVFNRRYFMLLNTFVIVASISRSTFLLIDPYNYGDLYPDILNYFLFKTMYPCLTSAFGIIFILLSEPAKANFLKPVAAIAINSFYLVFSLTSDILVGWFGRSVALILVSQLTFVLWMGFLSVCYFYNYQTLLNVAAIKHNELLRMTFSRGNFGNSNLRQNIPKIAYCLIIKITLIASMLGILLSVLHLCGIIFCLTAPSYITPWLWWNYQTFCRLLEVLMSCTIAFLAGNTKHLSFRGESFTYSFCSAICWCKYRTTFRNQRHAEVKTSSSPEGGCLTSSVIPSTVTKCELMERPNSLFTIHGYNKNSITTITEETENCETTNRMLYVPKLNEFLCIPADKASVDSDYSVLANAGSKIPSVADEESPFARKASHLKKWSPCSSADVSSDQMTPARTIGDEPKHGSSCSSESAGNSFDVALFRNNAFWFWSKESNNVARYGHGIVGSPFRLELFKNTVNVACGTDDISPDSAINIDVENELLSPALKQCSSECALDLEGREEFVDYKKTALKRSLSDRQHSIGKSSLKHGESDGLVSRFLPNISDPLGTFPQTENVFNIAGSNCSGL